MTPEDAEASLAQLEAALGYHLTNLPIALRDQWNTRVRSMLTDLRVDVDNQDQVNAAFAGAYLMANILLPGHPVPMYTAGYAVGMLRSLFDRAHLRSAPAADLEAMLAQPDAPAPPRRRWLWW